MPPPSAWFVAAVVGALLFGLLQIDRASSPRSILRSALFSLIAAGVALSHLTPARPRVAAAASSQALGAAFPDFLEGTVGVSQAIATRGIAGPAASAEETRGLDRLKRAVSAAPVSRLFRRQYGLALLGLRRDRDALEQLSAIPAATPPADRRDVEREAALWRRLLGARRLSRTDAADVEAGLRALPLGRFGAFALARVARLSGDARRADRLESELQARLATGFALAVLLILPLLAGAVCGLALLVTVLIARARDRTRLAPRAFGLPATMLWEAWIAYMALWQLSPYVLIPLTRALGLGKGGWTIVVISGLGDVISLLPLVWLGRQAARCGVTLADIGLHRKGLARNVGFGVIAYLCTLPIAVALNAAAGALLKHFLPSLPEPYHPLTGWLVTSTAAQRVGLYALAAIGAPFVEETFFRGMLYGALRRRWGVCAGVLGSSFIFAILHPQVPLGFAALFVLGAGMALAYELSGSLVTGMATHWANNSVAVILSSLLLAARPRV
jgi:membrane protease YdiL (CAAX protease family)